jgi:hypothetical protein
MNALESIINWRKYLRNRLHRVLQRGGWELLNTSVFVGNENITPISLVQDLDFTQLSQCSSIERFALKLPENEQRFQKSFLEHLPTDQGSKIFAEKLHEHYSVMIEFISSISPKDCDKILETPNFKDVISVQWILEFGNFYEQSITSRIVSILAVQDPHFRVPWSTTQFLKPVKKLDI